MSSAMRPVTLTCTGQDLTVLHHIAHGASEYDLVSLGLYPNPPVARREVAGLGCSLNGGRPVRWTRIVHLAVTGGLIAAPPGPCVWLPPWQQSLLYAWRDGWSLAEFTYEAGLDDSSASELEVLLCARLDAVNDQHAVLRSHQPGTPSTASNAITTGQRAEETCSAPSAATAAATAPGTATTRWSAAFRRR